MEGVADVADNSRFNGERSGDDASRVGLPCAEKGLVDLGKKEEPRERETCRVKNCTTKASYAVRGSKECELCRKHAANRLDMVAVYGMTCTEPRCIRVATFGPPFPPTRREFCPPHRKPGMVCVAANTCFREGCGKERRYGVAGSNFPEFCASHAVDGMVPMRNQSCDRPGCVRLRKFGVPGSNSEEAEFCAIHAEEGMVNLLPNKAEAKYLCSHPGCVQVAWYGPSGHRRLLCFKHAEDGMLGPKGWVKEAGKADRPTPEAPPSVDGLCVHPSGCTKKATHGVRGSRKRELCIEHAKDTPLVYLSGYWCTAPGCDKWPSFGVAGRAREVCGAHVKAGMVNMSLGAASEFHRPGRLKADKANVSSRYAATKAPALPPPRENEIGIKRELPCEEPCTRWTLRHASGIEQGSEDAPEAHDTRQREPPQLVWSVGQAVGSEQGNQAAPIDAACQADVVEPFMGFKKRRRRVHRDGPLGWEAGVQLYPSNC